MAALAVVGLGIIPGIASADPASPTPPGIAPPAPGPPAALKTTIDADGTYVVGTDIAPGIYSSAGPVGEGTCSWRRTSNPDGATIDNALSHKPQIVQIDATDKDFKTRGCQTWQLTPDATPDTSTMSPIVAGLQLHNMMSQLNGRAAASGQLPPP